MTSAKGITYASNDNNQNKQKGNVKKKKIFEKMVRDNFFEVMSHMRSKIQEAQVTPR